MPDQATPRFASAGFERELLLRLMRERGLGGVLLTSPENVFYTTGYTGLPTSGNPILYTLRSRLPYFGYVDKAGKVFLLCWGFSAADVEFGADEVIGFNDMAGALDALRNLLSSRQVGAGGSLGIESSCPHYVLAVLDELPAGRGELAVVDDLLASMRLIKSAAEIELIKTSTEIVERTVSELYPCLELGISRVDLMRQAKSRLIANGATGISHVTFSFGQANPEIAIGEKLGPNRLVTLDLGAVYEGYCSDNRRYAYTGPVPAALQEHYDTMVGIVDAIGAELVPGARYGSLFRLALSLFERHRIAPLARFNHVGHNIGLETEEEWLGDDEDATVRAGMAINIELYSIASTGEYIGDEETYIITDDGPERITVLPREFREIR